MLLEMSMKMGQKHVTNDVRELAQRRANRQQQRILLQITVVALIFYAYMTAYYISYYITALQTTYAMVFNSFFYSTTHMINPVIYFSLNSEMRKQLRNALRDFFYCLTRKRRVGEFESRMNSQYNNNSTVKSTCPRPNRDSEPTAVRSATTLTESSPLFSSGGQYKSTSNQLNSLREMHLSESLTKLVVDVDDSPIIVKTSRRGSLNLLAGVATNKVPPEERTALLDGLIRVLQASESRHSRLSVAIAPTEDGMVRRWPFTRQSHSLDIPVQSTGKYVRVSMTAHELCEVLADELKAAESSPEEMERCSQSMQHLAPPRMTPHFSSLHVLCERRNDTTTTESEEDSPLRFTGSSSSTSSRPTAWLPLNTQDSLTLLIQEQSTSDSEEEEDDEEDIAYL